MSEHYERIKARFYRPEPEWVASDKAVLMGLISGINKDMPHPENSRVLRMAEYLRRAADELPVRILEDELIVGTDVYEVTPSVVWNEGFYSNNGHYHTRYDLMLSDGPDIILERARAMKHEGDNKRAFISSLEAFERLVERYSEEARRLSFAEADPARAAELSDIADSCAHLVHNPPRTYREALQMIFFTQILLHLEGLYSNSMSFGSMDRYLEPFYEADIAAGRLTVEDAEELWMCFAEKVSHCDVSQNIVLGGVDRDGTPYESEMTSLILRAQGRSGMRQPSLSLRVTDSTSRKVWDAALSCMKAGIGMPAFFGDEVVVRGLVNNGADIEDARDYAIIGCYEATPQGKTFCQTTATVLTGYEAILTFLERNDLNYADFDEFYRGFTDFYRNFYIEEKLPMLQATRDAYERDSASPFRSCLMDGCFETGLQPEEYGVKYNWFGLDFSGIGTLIDSIYTIKKLVFDEKFVTLDYLASQVKDNFTDEELYVKCRRLEGKFGTNSPESNEIGRKLTEFLSDLIVSNKLRHGATLSPALFAWLSDVYTANVPATPDGRRKGDRTSYGASSSEIAEGTDPLSILASAGNLRLDLFPNGCPITMSYPALTLKDGEGEGKLIALIKQYFALGGFHIQFNLLDADTLRDAQTHPENHKQLLIRLSGHSNYFIYLDKTLQNALIERTACGR